MKRIIYLLAILISLPLCAQTTSGNQNMRLTLKEAISLAKLQSLASFRQKNMYLSSYWQFRSYKARLLPSLNLNTSPFNYSASNTQTYDYEGKPRFTYNEAINTSASLSVDQNIKMTGGKLSLSSDFQGIYNLNDSTSRKESYNVVPISIRLSQPLNGYNQFKWEAKLEPLAFDKAKKTFLKEMEALSEQAVGVFFGAVNAEIGVKIAQTNLANADTLHRIGKGRFQIGTITQNDLLDLELTYLNAKLSKTKAEIALQRARQQLNSFLSINKDIQIVPLIPDQIPTLKIESDQAIGLAKENSPEILGYEEQLINANKNVAQAKSTNGITANLSANLGINKNTNQLTDAYSSPYNDNKGIGVSLQMPIVDWGNRKGNIQMMKSQKQVTDATIKQALIDFEQNVIMQVLEFNLQEEQVEIAAKADTIAQRGYEVTKQRFLIDKVDVLKLNTARNSLDNSKRSYISAIQTYWSAYYSIRKSTLYDFEKNQYLTVDFEALLQQ